MRARPVAIWSILERACEEFGERLAWREGEENLDYRTVRDHAASVAGFFQRRGLEPGARVSILADNAPRYVSTYFAAAGSGLVLNPLNTRLSPAELRGILRDAGSRLLVSDQSNREQALALVAETELEEILWMEGDASSGVGWEEVLAAGPEGFDPPRVDADSPAQLYYTSGTTGAPKGVILTHRNVVRHAENARFELKLSPAEVWGHFAPLFHLADAWASFAVTMAGGAHSFVPRFHAAEVQRVIESERVTLSNLVPTMIVRLLAEQCAQPAELSSLRLLLSGGAPLAPAVIDELIERVGCEYAQTYGLTETSPYLTISLLGAESDGLDADARRARNSRTGRPFHGVELEVVDASDLPVRPNDEEVGEIRVRGETISPGYWQQPEETALVHRNGWFYTGDLAVVDEAGFVNIVDRKKDVILSGGETVYSTEVEHALYELSAISEAAVFGLPDDEWGERVAVALVLRTGFTLPQTELDEHCRARLAAYKRPREVHFVEALPRTGSGKIQKKALRARFSPDS